MLIIAPRIDMNGERWFTPKAKGKNIVGLRLKVASIENDEYRSRNALIRRHIEKLDIASGVGTERFSLESVGEIDSMDDLLMQNCAKFLLLGWEGVGEEVDGKPVPLDYTPENGVAMLKQKPDLYWQVIGVVADIARGKEKQIQESVGKPSKRKSSSTSSAASRQKRLTGGDKS